MLAVPSTPSIADPSCFRLTLQYIGGLVSVCLFSRAQEYAIACTACGSEAICLSVCDCKKSFIEFSCSVSP